MATRKTTPRRDVACVTIGHIDYLLDVDKAIQVVKLFRDAVECRRYLDHDRNRFRYIVSNRPELELTLIDAAQVDIPNGAPTLEDRRR